MMERVHLSLAAAVLTLMAGVTVVHAEKGEDEEISLAKVPAKVLEAARKAVPGIKLTEAEVEKTRKGVVYELEGNVEGKEYEIEVSAEGKVLEIEQDEEEIPLSKVPEKVLEAARKALPGIKLTEAEVEKTRKGVVYELEGSLGGKEYEIEVTAEGRVLGTEQEDEDDDEAEGDGTAKKAEEQTLSMKHTGGWGTGVLAELAVNREGRYRYRTKKEDLRGTIPPAEMNALIRLIAAAGAGPAAEDAGYVQFKWVDENGKAGARDYSYPRKEPCHSLLGRIRALATKHSKESAEQQEPPE